MEVPIKQLSEQLLAKGLKVTPQRMAILGAVYELENHPTAENIIGHIRKGFPNIASGTVYKVLDTLVENKLVRKIATEKDIMRYDGTMETHHHLYDSVGQIVADYKDEELDRLLKNYFEKKQISEFKIDEIELHIKGKFDN